MNNDKIKLKFISNILPKSNIKASDGNLEGKFPFFTSSQIQNKFLDDYIFNNESLIFGTGGSASIHYYKGEFSVSTDCMVLDINKNFYTKYVFYYLKSLQNIIDDLGFEGVGIKHLQKDFLFNLNISNIPYNNQVRIANYLEKKVSEIGRNIAKNKELISLLEEKKISLINQIVTKGPDSNISMKDSGIEWIGEIPESSKIMPFRRICYLSQGLQFPQEERLEKKEGNALLYITVKYLNSIEKIEEYIPNPFKRVICNPEDVLLARTGATGEVFTNLNGVFHNNFFKINYNNTINKDYLVYYLRMDAVKQVLLLKAGVTTIPDLNHNSFLETPFILHDKFLQDKIVTYLDFEISKIDKTIEKIKENIDLLEEYKTSLIHHVVTGKIDVRDEI